MTARVHVVNKEPTILVCASSLRFNPGGGANAIAVEVVVIWLLRGSNGVSPASSTLVDVSHHLCRNFTCLPVQHYMEDGSA